MTTQDGVRLRDVGGVVRGTPCTVISQDGHGDPSREDPEVTMQLSFFGTVTVVSQRPAFLPVNT